MTVARVSRVAVEVLSQEPDPNARVSRVAVEVLSQEPDPNARVSRVAVEVLQSQSVLLPNVFLDHLGPTATVFGPVVSGPIQLSLISSTTLFAPTITSAGFNLPTIASTQIFAPTLVLSQIQLTLISGTQMFAPVLTAGGTILLAHIGPVTTFFAFAVGKRSITLPRIIGTFVHTPSIDDTPPVVTINTPTVDQVITAGDSISLTASVSGAHSPFTYTWTFGGSSGIAPITTQDPGTVQFDQVGTFTVTLVATDSLGNSSAPVTFSVTVLPSAPAFVDNRGVWAEAWELPHKELIGYEAKKIAYLPTIDYMGGLHADAFREEGAITLHRTYDRLDEVMDVDPEDHTNDVGSTIKLFHAAYVDTLGFPRPFFEFVTERRPDRLASKHTATTQITGRGLTAFYLDRTKLYPWDYPVAPKSLEEDWHYGAANELPNPGFEDGSVLNEKQTIWVAEQPDEVDPENWQIAFSLNGIQTTMIDWIPNTTEMEEAMLAAWPQFTEIRVTGAGIESDPWVVEFTDPVGVDVTSQIVVVTGSLSASFNVVNTVQNGGTMLPTNWEPSQNPITGIHHGLYELDGWRLSAPGEVIPVEGSKALRINPETTTTFQAYPGAQQIHPVLPGHRYFGYVSVNPETAGGAFTLVVRYVDPSDFASSFEEGDTYGEIFIAASSPAGSGQILPPNTWTQLPVFFTTPIGVEEVIFRVARNGGTFPTFYVDEARLSPGAPAASWGKIWGELYADAAFDHIAQGRETLHFFNKTWTDEFDSAGNAWIDDHPEHISISLPADMSYGQIAEQGQNLYGFIHRIIWNPETGVYDFNIYNKGKAGLDLPATTTTGTFTSGMNIADGEALKATPAASYVRVRGKDGIWAEQRNVAVEAAWGQAETSVDEPDLSGDFTQVLAHHHDKLLTDTIAFEINLHAEGQVIPFVHFNLFDIVQVNPGDETGIDPQNLHVVSVVVSGQGHEKPKFQVHVGTDVFTSTGAAAQAEGLRRLLRHWNRRRPRPRPVRKPQVGCCPSCPAIIEAFLNVDPMPLDGTSGVLDFIVASDPDGLVQETTNWPQLIRPGLYGVHGVMGFEWDYSTTGWANWLFNFHVGDSDSGNGTQNSTIGGDSGPVPMVFNSFQWGHTAFGGAELFLDWRHIAESTPGLVIPGSGSFTYGVLTIVRHSDGCARPPEPST